MSLRFEPVDHVSPHLSFREVWRHRGTIIAVFVPGIGGAVLALAMVADGVPLA